jgi:hypothetical protein
MENNLKQTAFEWYIEQYNRFVLLSNNMPIEERMKRLMDLVDKTKEMEKNQIINAHEQGQSDEKDYWNIGDKVGVRFTIKSEQYYNETYGGDK